MRNKGGEIGKNTLVRVRLLEIPNLEKGSPFFSPEIAPNYHSPIFNMGINVQEAFRKLILEKC